MKDCYPTTHIHTHTHTYIYIYIYIYIYSVCVCVCVRVCVCVPGVMIIFLIDSTSLVLIQDNYVCLSLGANDLGKRFSSLSIYLYVPVLEKKIFWIQNPRIVVRVNLC